MTTRSACAHPCRDGGWAWREQLTAMTGRISLCWHSHKGVTATDVVAAFRPRPTAGATCGIARAQRRGAARASPTGTSYPQRPRPTAKNWYVRRPPPRGFGNLRARGCPAFDDSTRSTIQRSDLMAPSTSHKGSTSPDATSHKDSEGKRDESSRSGSGNFANDPERASEAGRKGGKKSRGGSQNKTSGVNHGTTGNFVEDADQASESGRKSGQHSHGGKA